MEERGAGDSSRTDSAMASRPATCERDRVVEVAEGLGDRSLMRFADRRLHRGVADSEEDARALRCRERHVEAGHGAAAPEFDAREWSLSGEHALQLFGADGTAEPELSCAASVPLASGLGAANVVVLGSRGDGMCWTRVALDLVEVVPRLRCLELADGDHRPSGRRAGRSGHRISSGVTPLTDRRTRSVHLCAGLVVR